MGTYPEDDDEQNEQTTSRDFTALSSGAFGY